MLNRVQHDGVQHDGMTEQTIKQFNNSINKRFNNSTIQQTTIQQDMKAKPNKMRKLMLTAAFAVLIAFTASAQVFVLDGDNNRTTVDPNFGEGFDVPDPNLGNDVHPEPLSSGTLLLVALGGAYLLGKKHEERG